MLMFFLQQILTSLWACETPGLGNICLLVSSDWTVQPAPNPACLVYYPLTENSSVKSGEGTVCSLQISFHVALTRRRVMCSRILLRQSAKLSDRLFHALYCPPRHCPSHSAGEGGKSNKKWGHSSQDVPCYHSEFKYLFHPSISVFKYLTKHSPFQQKHDTQT